MDYYLQVEKCWPCVLRRLGAKTNARLRHDFIRKVRLRSGLGARKPLLLLIGREVVETATTENP